MKEIIAAFVNGRSAKYTTEVFPLLIEDEDVLYIMDAETGELLYLNYIRY